MRALVQDILLFLTLLWAIGSSVLAALVVLGSGVELVSEEPFAIFGLFAPMLSFALGAFIVGKTHMIGSKGKKDA